MCSAGLRRAAVAIALSAGLLQTSVAPAATDEAIFHVKDVEKGQRGYGLSVFAGAEIERFEFEVLGVWENLQPGTSYVLARLEGQGLEDTGVIAGMSGSPVYLDGRLLGAVSFGWPFSKEPIAGITPVEHMRTMLSGSKTASPLNGVGLVTADQLLTGEVGEARLRSALEALRPERIGEASVAIEWSSAGFGGNARSFLEEALGGPVVASGTVSNLGARGAQAPAVGSSDARGGTLEPGSAVAAVLVDGDLRLAATGTVTERVGDSILAFGHPFLGLGALSIPMASADVLTVVSSQWTSFKVANLGPVVGAIDFDFLTGIRGVLGGVAPVVPLTVQLDEGAPLRMSLARLPRLLPTLAAISILGALDAQVASVGAESVDLELDLALGARSPLSIRQSFDGPGASLAAAIHVFAVTGYLAQTRLAEVDLTGIAVRLTTHSVPKTMTLIGAHPSRSVVRPGETVRINVDLAAYRGGRERRELEVEVPSDLAAGRYILLVGDGYNVDAVRLSIERAEPETLTQALSFLESLHSRRELRALGLVEVPGLSVAGEVFPDLPGSVRSLWAASGGGGAQPLRMAIVEDVGVLLDRPVEGLLRVDLEVERGLPVVGRSSGGSEPDGGDDPDTGPERTTGSGSEAQPPAEATKKPRFME